MLRTTLITTAAALFAIVSAGSASASDATCALRVVDLGGSLAIEPVVTSPTAIDGDFDLAISGGGTQIAQSGSFSAAAGAETSLGTMSLTPGKFTAKLKVTWAGGSAQCAQAL